MGVRAGAGEQSTLQRCEQIKLIRVLRSGETEAAGAGEGEGEGKVEGEGALGPCCPAEKRGTDRLYAGLCSHLPTITASVDMLIAGAGGGGVWCSRKKTKASLHNRFKVMFFNAFL